MYNDFNKLLDSFKPASAESIISGPGDKRRRKAARAKKKNDRKAAKGRKNHCNKATGCRAKVMTGGNGRRQIEKK